MSQQEDNKKPVLSYTNNRLNLYCPKCKFRAWRTIKLEQYSHKFFNLYWLCGSCFTTWITRTHIMDSDEYLGIREISN